MHFTYNTKQQLTKTTIKSNRPEAIVTVTYTYSGNTVHVLKSNLKSTKIHKETYTLDQHFRVISSSSLDYKNTMEFNNNFGLISKQRFLSETSDCTSESSYHILSKDSRGNWTKMESETKDICFTKTDRKTVSCTLIKLLGLSKFSVFLNCSLGLYYQT